MKKAEAEALKIQILERRDYFKQFNKPLQYSKRELRTGMQGRVARQEDRRFMKEVGKRKVSLGKDISTIEKYLRDLSVYNNRPQHPVGEGIPEIKAPSAPNIKLRPVPKRKSIRRGKAGIRGRGYSY